MHSAESVGLGSKEAFAAVSTNDRSWHEPVEPSRQANRQILAHTGLSASTIRICFQARLNGQLSRSSSSVQPGFTSKTGRAHLASLGLVCTSGAGPVGLASPSWSLHRDRPKAAGTKRLHTVIAGNGGGASPTEFTAGTEACQRDQSVYCLRR